MCIKILNSYSETKYNSSIPLEEQLKECHKVIIKYEPKDPDMDRFLDEMERLCKNGISCDVSVDVDHNNHLKGIKSKKQVKRLLKDLDLNEVVKILANLQQKTDRYLEEMSNQCFKR